MTPEIAAFFHEVQVSCQGTWTLASIFMVVIGLIAFFLILLDIIEVKEGFSVLTTPIACIIIGAIAMNHIDYYNGAVSPQVYVRTILKRESSKRPFEVPKYIEEYLNGKTELKVESK